jgi:hypothetical protein
VTPAYNLAAKYDPGFSGEYQLDNATGIATLTAPTPALKDFKLQMKPMLGCISVDVIKGYQSQGVREEDNDYIISFGAAGSLQEALKTSTAQLATWIKHDYGLFGQRSCAAAGSSDEDRSD